MSSASPIPSDPPPRSRRESLRAAAKSQPVQIAAIVALLQALIELYRAFF